MRGVLATLAVLAVSNVAIAQENKNEAELNVSIPSPVTSVTITPPIGNSAFLLGHGVGTQGYVCLPSGIGASWTVNAAPA